MQQVMYIGETEVKVLHSMLIVCWMISKDYQAINKSKQGKPSGVSVGEVCGDRWKKWWIS